MVKWINENVVYPQTSIEMNEQGRVLLLLYDNITYINHSCSPNAYWMGVEIMKVRVCRRIEEGEEIVACYLPSTCYISTREERVKVISEKWDFFCRCQLCSLSGDDLKRNDLTRKILMDLRKRMREAYDRQEYDLAFETSEQIVEVMDKIKDGLIMKLPSALVDCSQLAALAGGEEAAARYKERALALATTLGKEVKMKIVKIMR